MPYSTPCSPRLDIEPCDPVVRGLDRLVSKVVRARPLPRHPLVVIVSEDSEFRHANGFSLMLAGYTVRLVDPRTDDWTQPGRMLAGDLAVIDARLLSKETILAAAVLAELGATLMFSGPQVSAEARPDLFADASWIDLPESPARAATHH